MSLAYYEDGWSNDTSLSPFITTRIIENGSKQAIRFAITRYFDGVNSLSDKRYFHNEEKKLIPPKQYEDSIP